jgi:hypothetical protein
MSLSFLPVAPFRRCRTFDADAPFKKWVFVISNGYIERADHAAKPIFKGFDAH